MDILKNRSLSLILLSLSLVGCNADMIIDVPYSYLSDEESNGKIIDSYMVIKFFGSCFDGKTGAESDSLSESDGMVYNLFKQNQERVSCKTDDWGINSEVIYKFKIGIDTIKDGKNSTDLSIHIASNSESGHNIVIDKVLSGRIKSRLSKADGLDYSLIVRINNDTEKPFRLCSNSTYYYNESTKSYEPWQYLDVTNNNGQLALKQSDVAIDALLNHGAMNFGWNCG